jgi:uroporphyrinogen-III decarboxylase
MHAGTDEFMSPSDYEKFYWPGLKRTIEAIIDAGMIPYVFCEGKYNTRLEVLRDVPRGKVVYLFEQVDIKRAKKVLGDVACICGNISSTLLAHGKPEQVIEKTKELIDICAPGGGFIMDCSIIVDTATHENFSAWRDTTFTYGVYH